MLELVGLQRGIEAGKKWRGPNRKTPLCCFLMSPACRKAVLELVTVIVHPLGDIEDEDRVRYGEPTLHEEHGVPVALNVGDLLLGEGYRLLSELDAPADVFRYDAGNALALVATLTGDGAGFDVELPPRSATLVVGRRPIFADGFETGDVSAWSGP